MSLMMARNANSLQLFRPQAESPQFRAKFVGNRWDQTQNTNPKRERGKTVRLPR